MFTAKVSVNDKQGNDNLGCLIKIESIILKSEDMFIFHRHSS